MTKPKARSKQVGWYRERPKLTDEQVETFLDAALRESQRDWLVFRLIVEAGLRSGEVVGNESLPGIHVKDLGEDAIFIHTKRPGKRTYFYAKASSDLLRELRRFATLHEIDGKLFHIGVSRVEQLAKAYAKKGRIPDPWLVNPEILRDFFTQYSSPFSFDVGQFPAAMLRRAQKMAQYYIATFCIERGLRDLIAHGMIERYGHSWWAEKIDPTLKEDVKIRQERELATLTFKRSDDPLEYTLLTELIGILEKYWNVFSDQFKRSASDMKRILFTLNQERDVIAHNSELKDEEKRRFGTLVSDWFGVRVEK